MLDAASATGLVQISQVKERTQADVRFESRPFQPVSSPLSDDTEKPLGPSRRPKSQWSKAPLPPGSWTETIFGADH